MQLLLCSAHPHSFISVIGLWVHLHSPVLFLAPVQIDVLEEVASAVGDKMDVYLDGGIRRGTDVFKALARGAKAVFIGRPSLWGLSYKVQ